MIKAAFFDVDGTLLSHKTKEVPQSARRALEKLKAAGVKCIVATGRHLGEMEKLPVGDITFDGYITLNGQLCLDGSKQMLCGTPIEGQMKENLVNLFEENRLPILLIEEKQLYLNFVNDQVHRVQALISSDIPELGSYTGNPIYQAAVYSTAEEVHILVENLPDCEITRWSSGGVDVIAKGGGKVAGIRRYLEENGISVEETIAFGDGQNDEEMLRFAGIGVAMGNAGESVKRCADYVTADIDADGIELALKHFGLIE